jgi:hypothetical protein
MFTTEFRGFFAETGSTSRRKHELPTKQLSMKRLLAFIIVVLAVPASAAYGGGEGGVPGKGWARVWNTFAFRTLGLVANHERRGLT